MTKLCSPANSSTMKLILSLVLPFFGSVTCFAQETTLSDSLIKSEVILFTHKGTALKKSDSLSKTMLMEIPISSCSEQEVHLSWSTVTSSVSTFIHF